MATIAGSQFSATASAIAYPGGVNVVETSTGTGLPAALPTDFNLEVYTGPAAGAPTTPFSGYQGLAILTPGGYSIELLGSGYAVTDDTLVGFGAGGTDTLNVFGAGDTITGGSGTDVLGAYADNVQVFGGTGPSTVFSSGTGDTVTAGSGNMTVYAADPNANLTFVDNGSALYDDTLVGFGAGGTDTIKLAAGDSVATSTVSNGNTQVVLSDGSKILLVGVTDITGLFHH